MNPPVPGRQIRVFEQPHQLYDALTESFLGLAEETIRRWGVFRVALAGGSTPIPLYQRLSAPECSTRIDWKRVDVAFGDERCVPPTEARSNYRMVQETLLDQVPIPPERIHRIDGGAEPHLAAAKYRGDLARLFRTTSLPGFDLILLGMGSNGHVASLFPGSGALREQEQSAVAQYLEIEREWRVTLTRPVLAASQRIWVMVKGEEKAATVREALQGEWRPEVCPAQYLTEVRGELIWWLDQAAAAGLDQGPTSGSSGTPVVRFI